MTAHPFPGSIARALAAALAAAVILAPFVAPGVAPAAPLRPALARPAPGDSGTFRLYKLQAPVGVETYRTRTAGDSLVLEARWEVAYLGGRVDQTVSLAWDAGGRPVRLTARGATSTMTRVDVEVGRTAAGDSAVVRRDSATMAGPGTMAPWPAAAFAATPYGPYAVEQALFRHWVRLGRPPAVPLVPEGEARFERRGADTVRVAGHRMLLDRYLVRGLGWGAQVAWFDASGRLVAAAQGDAELDRMEAIRAGYETMLPLVVARSVTEGIAEQAAVGRTVPPVRAGTYALTNARLIDGTGAPVVDGATIVVRAGRIDAAGPTARVPPGVPVVNLGGRTVIPGLWDLHVHYEQAEWPLVSLAAGVTTARDVGNEFEWAVALRDALDRGTLLGPRLLLAGVIDGRPDSLGQALGVVTAGTQAEARAAVRRYARAGFQQIKVYQSVPPALVPVIAAEAHRLGLTVTGHVPTGMDARQFVEAGADQINHWNSLLSVLRAPTTGGRPGRLDVESDAARTAIALLAARGTVVDPSFARAEQHAHPRDSGYAAYEPGVAKVPWELRGALESTGVPAAATARGAASRRAVLAVAAALVRGGVPLVLGTDLAVPGHSIYRELELAVAAGLTPMQALQAATLAPARAMRLAHDAGTVAPGKRADLVVLDADPLADIRHVRRVRWVMRGGRLYESAALWRAAGFAP